LRHRYKAHPLPYSHSAVFNEQHVYHPILTARLSNPRRHSPPTDRFDAFVDSGSPDCYFHADIGRAVGIRIEDGQKSALGGVVAGPRCDTYFHEIALHVEGDIIRVKAGFTDSLAVSAILGRRGFFDHFIVTFDHGGNPPEFEIRRIRAILT